MDEIRRVKRGLQIEKIRWEDSGGREYTAVGFLHDEDRDKVVLAFSVASNGNPRYLEAFGREQI